MTKMMAQSPHTICLGFNSKSGHAITSKKYKDYKNIESLTEDIRFLFK